MQTWARDKVLQKYELAKNIQFRKKQKNKDLNNRPLEATPALWSSGCVYFLYVPYVYCDRCISTLLTEIFLLHAFPSIIWQSNLYLTSTDEQIASGSFKIPVSGCGPSRRTWNTNEPCISEPSLWIETFFTLHWTTDRAHPWFRSFSSHKKLRLQVTMKGRPGAKSPM